MVRPCLCLVLAATPPEKKLDDKRTHAHHVMQKNTQGHDVQEDSLGRDVQDDSLVHDAQDDSLGHDAEDDSLGHDARDDSLAFMWPAPSPQYNVELRCKAPAGCRTSDDLNIALGGGGPACRGQHPGERGRIDELRNQSKAAP